MMPTQAPSASRRPRPCRHPEVFLLRHAVEVLEGNVKQLKDENAELVRDKTRLVRGHGGDPPAL